MKVAAARIGTLGAALVAVAVVVAHAAAGTAAAGAATDEAAGARRVALRPAGAFYATPFEKTPSAAALTDLGQALFGADVLSASGRMSCATCHSPRHAFGPPGPAAVQRGGDGSRAGVRAVPSLMYAQNVPPFTEHSVDDEGDDSVDQGPAGGRTWDGRAQSAHDQARLPLFSAFEMGNADAAALVARVAASGLAARFRDTFGAHVFEHSDFVLNGLTLALETYQQTPAAFYPYSSKYDEYLRGRATLSAPEARGLAIFNDPARGNCARCHPSGLRRGAFPQFTDFGYAALGLPRNREIPADAERGYVDLGLCGPLRTDLAARREYCGLFRTPTLRNIAMRRVFFHNGVMHRLADAVRFYAHRDPRSADLPLEYRGNLEREAPFASGPAGRPTLRDADVADVVAFLNTLTDGYTQGH